MSPTEIQLQERPIPPPRSTNRKPGVDQSNRFGYRSGYAEQTFIDPINHYTGEVSVLTIMENQLNGHVAFPANMGETRARFVGIADVATLQNWLDEPLKVTTSTKIRTEEKEG